MKNELDLGTNLEQVTKWLPSRVDSKIESYDDYEAVIEGRLMRAYDLEPNDRTRNLIQICWASELAVDAAMAMILGE